MADKDRSASGTREILRDWNDNHCTDSADILLELVYNELCRQAHRYQQNERIEHILQTTALIHEIYLKFNKQKVFLGKPVTFFRH